MTSSSAARYLLYAMGEIALVVIGIYLALQMNNWKEQKRNKEWENYYLNRLAEDIQNDLHEIEVTSLNNCEVIFFSNELLMNLGNEDYIQVQIESVPKGQTPFLKFCLENQAGNDTQQLLKVPFGLRKIANMRRAEWRRYSYDELMSSGRFELISSHELRESIAQYYWGAADAMASTIELNLAHKNFIDFFQKENLAILDRYDEKWMSHISDKEGCLTVLKNLIHFMVRHNHLLNNYVKSRAESALDDINQYLEADAK